MALNNSIIGNPFAYGIGASAAAGKFDNDPVKKQKAIELYTANQKNIKYDKLNLSQAAQVEGIDNAFGIGKKKVASILQPVAPINQQRTQQGSAYVGQKTLLGA